MRQPDALAEKARQPEYGAVQAAGGMVGGRQDEIGAGAGNVHQAGRGDRVSFALRDDGGHYGQSGYRDTHPDALDQRVPTGFGLALSDLHPSPSSIAGLHPHTSLFPNTQSTLPSPPSSYHLTNPALDTPDYSSPAFAGNHFSHHSYTSTAPILQNQPDSSLPDPPIGHKSDFYDFLGGYIDSYKPDERESLSEDEAEMASYNNQYGPPVAASNYSQQQGQHDYQRPQNNDQYDQYGYDSREQYSNYNSPYRDQRSDSPDMHPGIGQAPQTQRHDSSPSRSPPYGQQNNRNYAPYVGAGAAAGAAAPMNRTGDYTPNYGNSARYNALAASPSPERPTGELRDHSDRFSPYGPYQNYPQTQSSHASYSSADQLAGAAAPPALSTPRGVGFNNGGYGNGHGYGGYERYDPQGQYGEPQHHQHPYRNPYDNHSISRNNLNGLDYVDPTSIADDGDTGLEYHNPKRRSLISLGRSSTGMRSNPALGAAGAAGVAGAAAVHAAPGTGEASRGMYGGDMTRSAEPEKPSEFNRFSTIQNEEGKSRKRKKILLIILAVLLVCGIAGGVAAVLITKKKSDDAASNGGSGSSSGSDTGDLDKNSPSVKKLMNNKNLHKVFMGMAYTPINSQYPDCLTNKPIQNNVTLDLAVLSQLTNVLRLYGTDCGQTEMVLTAIDKLGLNDMKIWAGVWLDKNQTTTDRQIAQFWNIVDKFGTKYMKGVAVGNEVLFRKDLTITELQNQISNIRTNLTSKGMTMPVASSDLGDNWTADLASAVDVVMSNVHPFFGGLPVDQAAGWTWDFWQNHDVILTKGTDKKNIISEVGWPSQGGNDCGTGANCPDSTSGSVAGISQLNTFMNSWICQALTNGTDYFWFELLDEPWKVQFDTGNQQWEDHWGLMDVNRNLKPGVKIPDCGGKTIPALT